MDTITLVDELVDDGRRLLSRLVQENIPVTMACWVKPVDRDRWSLYIATPLLDDKGAMRAYREVYRVLRSLENSWVTDSDVSLVGAVDPITRDVLDIRKRSPRKLATRSKRPQLGSLAVEETYVYPATEQEGNPRQSFTVKYTRKNNTNEWNAETTRGEVIRGAEAKGAVGYSTAPWERETSADVKHAMIFVWLEIDPNYAKSPIEDNPELVRTLNKQANLTADPMFKRYHPDAVILRAEG